MHDELWFTYDGESLVDRLAQIGVRFTVLDIEGAGIYGKNVRTNNRYGADGSYRVSSELLERVIYVQYKIETLSGINHDSLVKLTEAETLINEVLHSNGLAELRTSIRDGYFIAELGEVTVNRRLAHYQTGAIEFICPSPFLFGERRTVSHSGGEDFG